MAHDLGSDWHAVRAVVVAVGKRLIDHPNRIGPVNALGLDATLFAKAGEQRAPSVVQQRSPGRGVPARFRTQQASEIARADPR